jgi:hypothetical protein
MHLGHFRSHVETRIQQCNPGAAGFFNARSWREFIQSGAAARLLALPSSVREPCCDLKLIGGDGTCIGVPIANASNVQPVWKPPAGTRDPRVDWGRLERCVIDSSGESSATERKDARSFVRSVTVPSISKDQVRDLRDNLDSLKEVLPKEIVDMLEVWFSMESNDTRWTPLRRIIHACGHEDSVLGILSVAMIPHVEKIIGILVNGKQTLDEEETSALKAVLKSIANDGMGPDIAAAVNCCISEQSKSRHTGRACTIALASLLKFVGKPKAVSHSQLDSSTQNTIFKSYK